MPEDLFRWIVAGAVVVASLAFVVQAAILFALYRAQGRVREETAPLVAKAQELAEHAAPAIHRLAPLIDRSAATLDRLGPVFDKAGPALDQATAILAATRQIVEDSRPRVAEMARHGVAIAKSGEEQVERLGDLLYDASSRARARLEQIDRSVDNTVEQVEQARERVKSAVTRPVREVNGIAAGVSAALAALVRGTRKFSVDSATQDEEMFI